MKNLSAIYKKFDGVDAVLVQSPFNTFFLTDYESSFSFVLLTKNGGYYFTDTRYIEEAKLTLRNIECIAVTPRNVFQTIREVLDKIGAVKIGFENGYVSYDCYVMMKTAFYGMALLGIDYTLYNIRAVKTRNELALIKKAAAINDKAFIKTLKKIKVGMTEKQLCCELEYNMKKLGADGLAFDTIAAFGENTSKPHAHPGDKKLAYGMPITLDFGSKYKGYCSDITRTFCFGEPADKQFYDVYETVLAANEAGIAAIKAGVATRHVDGVCREYLRNAGYEKYFLHGTGHGVGVEIHEAPTLNPNSDEILQKNSVVSVEPGVYIEGNFGVRVEDLIFVDDDGCKVASRLDKKLLIL